MTGAMCVDRRFNSHVEIGSRGHDFEGVVRNSLTISHWDTGWNTDSGGTHLSDITGSGAVAVDSRMLSTLFRKKIAKLNGVNLGAGFSTGG